MSISFTPSQTHFIALVTCNEVMLECESQSYGWADICDLHHMYRNTRMTGATSITKGWIETAQKCVESDYSLVVRAYARFRTEFEAYMSGCCNLREVRKYHRLLIGALAPFSVS